MKDSAIVIQKYMRRHLAKKQAEKRRKAAFVIKRFVWILEKTLQCDIFPMLLLGSLKVS